MEYFLLLPGDDKKSTTFDSNKLGETTQWGAFWPGLGFIALQNIVRERPDLIEKLIIVNTKGTEYNIHEFINLIDRYEIKRN